MQERVHLQKGVRTGAPNGKPTTTKRVKGQRVMKKVLKDIKCQADFPYAKLKCMRGDITEQEFIILSEVNFKEKSFAEIESVLIQIKEMCALQDILSLPVKKTYRVFRGDVVCGKSTKHFKSYVQRASSFKATDGTFKEGITILNIDCLSELCPILLDEKMPQY
ncbi:Hypothetical predicted protein [Paramuricea clavata]|uniref:Uncharacterized protein n=1 Tax=Paramuricea clavata TaxID=317549 RepID=A0A6S7GPD0_PARCT|nr:Hypothetical predicted protein [Paramuricea clavata]